MPEGAPGLTGLVARRLGVPVRGVAVGGAARQAGFGWIYAYVAVQFGCQLALLVKELGSQRVIFRSVAFGASLLFLLVIPGASKATHLSRKLVWVVLLILTLSAANPNGGAPLAVVAHWSLYLAILAPLFWVFRLKLDEDALKRLLLVLWAFHVTSAIVGLLQVFFPGQFQPAVTTFIAEKQVLTIRLASGDLVPRPMGLTDVPGGAASSGLFATLIGFGVVLARPFRAAPVIGLLSMIIGMACIYLSQVRSVLVMLGICFVVVTVLFAVSGRIPRLAGALIIGVAVIFVGFELASDVGGEMVTTRLASLVETDPGTVYRKNRGRMLEEAVTNLLPQYPLGAGLGHWGMMNAYFGSSEHEIGAELQWVAWLLDGGVPLILTYLALILSATFTAFRTTLRLRGSERQPWTAIVAAFDVGTLALLFSYTPFAGTSGLEFWLLNTVLMRIEANRPNEVALAPVRAHA